MNQKSSNVYLGASIYSSEKVNGKMNRVNHPSKGILKYIIARASLGNFQYSPRPKFKCLGYFDYIFTLLFTLGFL
jgi:hypothetical protein